MATSLARIHDCAVLIAFVQGVVGAFHENSGPFDERSGKKSREGADQNLLKEGGVHPFLKATLVPLTQTLCARCRSYIRFHGRHESCGFSEAMANPAEPKINETETLTRLLELELAQKRASWKHAGERARSIRAAGFVFLFFLILACLVGGYFAFMRVSEPRANPLPTSATDR
jgi:hypothetical protein